MESNNTDMSWRKNGNCQGLDPNLFFPDSGEKSNEAKAVCIDCPVKKTCLEYAVANGIEHGVWGGSSQREIKRIIKARRLANQAINQS